jgi:hypothetical protein
MGKSGGQGGDSASRAVEARARAEIAIPFQEATTCEELGRGDEESVGKEGRRGRAMEARARAEMAIPFQEATT